MLWLIINILCFISATSLVIYAKNIDSSENTEALIYGSFGIVFIAISIISELIRWIFW